MISLRCHTLLGETLQNARCDLLLLIAEGEQSWGATAMASLAQVFNLKAFDISCDGKMFCSFVVGFAYTDGWRKEKEYKNV